MINKRVATTLLLVLVLATAKVGWASAQADAAFQKIKSLAGSWEGKDNDGMAVKTKFEVLVNGTTVLETLSLSGMDDMLSVYSVDGDGVALIHYCPTNNQPRMRAVPPAGDINELDFIFRDAGNLPVATTGHQQRIRIHFDDNDHITESLTWRSNGKESVETAHLTRSH